jgi:FAD/FMN-containing dehydrogenase
LWPRRWRRSDVYHRLIGLDRRLGISTRLDRRKGEVRERVIQDVEVPVDKTSDYLAWFEPNVGMHPVWLCPLRLREPEGGTARTWPTYPLEAGTTYVNFGFWGTVPVKPGHSDGDVNRALEAKVHELGGHKSLYSDAFYDEATFDALYNTANLLEVTHELDPDGRLTGLYEKAVRNR